MRQSLGDIFFAARMNLNESLANSLACALCQIQSLGDLVLVDRLPLQ